MDKGGGGHQPPSYWHHCPVQAGVTQFSSATLSPRLGCVCVCVCVCACVRACVGGCASPSRCHCRKVPSLHDCPHVLHVRRSVFGRTRGPEIQCTCDSWLQGVLLGLCSVCVGVCACESLLSAEDPDSPGIYQYLAEFLLGLCFEQLADHCLTQEVCYHWDCVGARRRRAPEMMSGTGGGGGGNGGVLMGRRLMSLKPHPNPKHQGRRTSRAADSPMTGLLGTIHPSSQ